MAVVCALTAALGLTGCGRKRGLDPPPAQAAQPAPGARLDGAPGAEPEAPEAIDEQGRPIAAPPGQKKHFFLDWILD